MTCKLEPHIIDSWIIELPESNNGEGIDEVVAWLFLELLPAAFLPTVLVVAAFFLKETDWENNELPRRAPGEENLKEDNSVSEEKSKL